MFLHNAVNFVLYMLTGSKFRQAFRDTFADLVGRVKSAVQGRVGRAAILVVADSELSSTPEPVPSTVHENDERRDCDTF